MNREAERLIETLFRQYFKKLTLLAYAKVKKMGCIGRDRTGYISRSADTYRCFARPSESSGMAGEYDKI